MRAFTFGGDGVGLAGSHGDGADLGQVGARPPHLYLHEAVALVHLVEGVAQVEHRS